MNMQRERGSPEPPSGLGSRSLGLAFMLTSESPPDVMDSKPQSLCSSFSITAANGRKDTKPPSSSSEIGDARPKPPVKPKPCVLPKPAMPVKPTPGLRQTLSEVPSAEKINLLAGPKPYSSGAGSAVKRLSFNLKCSPREVTNGKEVPSFFSTASKSSEDKEDAEPTKKSSAIERASEEECRESSSVAKCTLPFKVKPVPVATKPERFPGTTVEEILAKIEKPSESSPSSERPRLVRSFFSQDGGSAVHLGPKGYVAFRRSSSGEEGVGTDPEGSVYRVSCEIKERSLSRNKELKEENRRLNEQHAPESQQPETEVKRNEIFLPTDSSSQPSTSCEGNQLESSSSPSSPGTKFSSRVTPGSPDAPSETTQPPGAPYLPTDVPCSEALLPPGSPDGSTKSSRSPLVDSVSHVPLADPHVTIADPWPPGSPIKTSPGQSMLSDLADVSARYPEVPLLPEHAASLTHPPTEYNLRSHQCLTGVSESPGSPSILSKCHVCSDQPPGSPSCIPDSLLNRGKEYLKNKAQILPFEEKDPLLNQRRASEGVVQPQGKKMVREELGGSLAALPKEKDPSVEQTLGGESSWSLSQSFEWSFPNQGLELVGKRLVSPPNSPIQEHDDDNLLEAELGGEIPPIQGSYQEAGSEGQIGKEEETEASEHSANKESESNWKKIEGQLETQSTLELSAPGGPSVQRKIGSPNLKGPVVAEEVTFQEDHDDFLQFPPNNEEEALRAMEPLPSVEETAPPAEPCILFSESAQVQTADTCQEECDDLGMAQEAKMGNSDLLGGVEPGSSSHWLDELLASPPPSADDTKKRSTSKVEDPTGPQDLLGWSRKDLHSEFGIVGADHSDTFHLDWTADVTRVKWLGETEQDREFGTGSQDWPNSYTVGNTKSQDMEFGTSQQEWARGSPLRGSSSPVQEEWLASYGSHGADHSTEESNWSSTYNISTAEGQHAEPYMRKPGWPSLCHAGSDQQSSEFAAVEKTDWSSQYQDAAAETTDWPKYHMENVSCPESDVSPESAKVPSEYTIESKLETEFCVKHSDDSTPVSVFSASHLGWPSESDSGSSTSQPQREFTAHQVELSSEPQNRPEDQLSFQQDSGPDTYGFDDGSYPESKLSVKLSDSPSRCGTEIAQNQVDEFSAGKSDGAKEYDGEIGCRIEIDGGMKGSNSQMEADNQEFYARRPIWSDEYCLGKFEPQEDTTGRGDWIKDSKFSESEQSDTIGQALIAGLGSLDLSDQKVTVNLEESTDNLIHQAGNLTNLAMDEPRGIGEGEPEWTQHLDTGELAISGDLKVESLEAYKKPAEKHLDWVLPFGMETSSASSNTRSVNAEEGREPDVGQADLINNMDVSDSEKTDVSGLRPKALDGAEVAYRGERRHLGDTVLEDDVMQHQGATPACGESRKCHSQRLSSPSCLLEGLVSSSANRPEVQQKRPASFHSCHSEEERKLNNLPSELVPAAEKIRQSPFPLEDVGEVLSDTDGDISQLDSGNGSQPPERQSESQATQPISQDDCALEGAEALTREKFTFLEDTEVLDNSAHRDRANLGRKRGHRAPITRAGSTGLENDRNSWMFRDSTEPQLVPAGSDEEVHEETKSKKSRSSPLSKGVKVALFPGLSPSALKAKLRGRNRSAEEVEPQGEVKEAPVQRSKSCKMGSTSGKPLVLPPKPDKSSGSETSSPNWLQVLKLKKKKS
ncbi:182 kDa tankyrase-1-binding protein-like isoform X11 [Ahaetulla prasina]|uniref:182 kDa tankyrase-1-binding protein-like isoform X11 n=1 Tax=Ahaetulla prasina TaxID=499056 RepID=UPI00264A2D5F|nr:182 kDa tankyrase-1-binding protein-like isoform X11 [Ahaetulla prasina]